MAALRITKRAAVAAFHLQLLELLESAGVTKDIDINDVTVNIDYRARRIDIAKLTPDGQHIERWVGGFSIDPLDLPEFGLPVGLPVQGPAH